MSGLVAASRRCWHYPLAEKEGPGAFSGGAMGKAVK
jgi:hypothetical protein